MSLFVAVVLTGLLQQESPPPPEPEREPALPVTGDAGVLVVPADQLPPDAGVLVISVTPKRKELSAYKVDLPGETAITGAAFFLFFMVDVLIKPGLQSGFSCSVMSENGQCDPATLSSFDRYAVGKSSTPWKIFGDVTLAVSVFAPVTYLALESALLPTDHPWRDFFADALVMTESIALTASITEILKFAFRRPRPSRYEPQPGPAPADTEMSLPSGHVAMVTAASTALTCTVFLRHPGSLWGYVSLAVGGTLSALTAVSRVQSGQHFPTDVLTGMVVGGFSGFLVPYMHRKTELRLTPSLSLEPSTGAALIAVSGPL